MALLQRLRAVSPGIADSAGAVGLSSPDVHLLRVRLERLPRWHVPGLLCIGDAAHAMSPAGGVGINLAIQDAVATARIVGPALRAGGIVDEGPLQAVQRRRSWPARVTQAVQRRVQGALLAVAPPATPMPASLRLLRRFPVLTHLTGRFVGLGVRPEHV